MKEIVQQVLTILSDLFSEGDADYVEATLGWSVPNTNQLT
jgi:hypothetical protein